MKRFPVHVLLTVAIPLALTPAHRVVLGTTLANDEDCSSADFIVEEGNITDIFTVQENISEKVEKKIYAKFENGFEGVSLMVEGITMSDQFPVEHCRQDTWFIMDNQCLRHSSWYEIKVSVQLKPNMSLDLFVMSKECIWCCRIHDNFTAFKSVTLTAHGPSRWTNTTMLSNSCSILPFESRADITSIQCKVPPPKNCTVPTASTLTSPPLPPSSFIAVEVLASLIVLGVVVMVVIVMLVARQMQRRRLTRSDSMMWRSQAAGETPTRENSLYESCDNYIRGAAVAKGRHWKHDRNSLYEPCENYTGRV